MEHENEFVYMDLKPDNGFCRLEEESKPDCAKPLPFIVDQAVRNSNFKFGEENEF